MKINIFFSLLSIALINIGIAQANSSAKNILLIAVDNLKPSLKSYDANKNNTPNFNRLVKIGSVFKNAILQQDPSGFSQTNITIGIQPDYTKKGTLQTYFKTFASTLLVPKHLHTQDYKTVVTGNIYNQSTDYYSRNTKSARAPYISKKYNDPNCRAIALGKYQNIQGKTYATNITKETKKKGIVIASKLYACETACFETKNKVDEILNTIISKELKNQLKK